MTESLQHYLDPTAVAPQPLTPKQQRQLLQVARRSIERGRTLGAPIEINARDYDDQLNLPGCCFITLEKNGRLQGCVGALIPYQSLLLDVAEHAYAAAYNDDRFPSLEPEDIADLVIEVSVLSPAAPLTFSNERDLLQQIEPGRDGLIIEDGHNHATFLPSVWNSLPDAELFLEQLKQKAGLDSNHWSENFKAWRYQSVSFH